MSQLNGLIKQINQCVAEWDTLKIVIEKALAAMATAIETADSPSPPSPSPPALPLPLSESLQLQQQAHQSLLHICDEVFQGLQLQVVQQREKLLQVDVVTGEARFGKVSKDKFAAAEKQYGTLIEDIQQVSTRFEEVTLKWGQVLREVEEQQSREKEKLKSKLLEEKKAQDEEVLRELIRIQEQEKEKLQRQEEEAALLHDMAESIRKKKMEEIDRLMQFEQQFHMSLVAFATEINERCGSMTNQNKVNLLTTIKIFLDDKELARGRTAKEILGMIAKILERIIARPDDVNARKLRLTHAVIQEKLTTVPSCLELLVSLGFKVVIICPELSVKEVCGPQWCHTTAMRDKLEQKLGQLAMDHNLAQIVDLLNPNSPFDACLAMEEPPVDTGLLLSSSDGSPKYEWVDWYDGLKMNLEIINDFMVSHSLRR